MRRYKAGEFGNASPTWNSPGEFLVDQATTPSIAPHELVHLRNRVASGITRYNVPANRVYPVAVEMVRSGVKVEDIYISAMAPHHLNLLQGEVRRSEKHLDLYYSTEVGLPMRDALKKSSRQVYGIVARDILEHCLCWRSLEWLNYLLDAYPNHVVEFSTFEREWGTVPGFNTTFWEVRLY